MPGGRNGRNSNRAGTPPLSTTSSPKSKDGKIFRDAIPVFDPSDFHSWAFQMEVVMSAANCYGAIDHQSNRWGTATPEKKDEMQNKASLYLNLSLGKDYRYICAGFKPNQAKELYEKIRNMFIKNDVETRMSLTSKLTSLAWTAADHVDTFLGKVADIRTAYKNANVFLDETELFCRMLSCLPQEFDMLNIIMRGWPNPDFDRARVAMLHVQEELRKRKKYSDANPLTIGDSSAFLLDGNKRKRDEMREDRLEKRKKEIVCNYCFRAGHYRKNCHTKMDDEENEIKRQCIPDEELPKHARERKAKLCIVERSEEERGHAHAIVGDSKTNSSFRIVDDDEPDGWCY